MNRRHLLSATVILLAGLVVGGTAFAEMSKPVIGAFKGQLIVSAGELPEGKNDKDTIAKIKAAKVASVTGQANEDVHYWSFHYTAFLSKTGASKLKMEFYNGKNLAADKHLDGIDPKNAVLSGDIQINEDEGLTKGKTYTIKLLNGNSVVSSTQLTFK